MCHGVDGLGKFGETGSKGQWGFKCHLVKIKIVKDDACGRCLTILLYTLVHDSSMTIVLALFNVINILCEISFFKFFLL